MVTIQEKLNIIKQQEDYIEGSLKLEYSNHEGCKYSYLCENCEDNSVRKYVFYGFIYDSEKNIEDQIVTSESIVDCNDLQNVNITDGINSVEIIEKALKTYPIETTEVRWTTEADFNKGTHNDTQTIADGGGGISLLAGTGDCYACWHLNETSGDNVSDSSGNGRVGTRVNMEDADWVAGKLNNCLLFDGINEVVNFVSHVTPVGTKSIECWIKTSVNNIRILGNNGETTTKHGVEISIGVDGKVAVLGSQGTPGTWRFLIEGVTSVDNGVWNHIVYTWDGTTNENAVKLYVNNNLDAQGTANTVETVSATHILQLGNVGDGSAPYFNGYLDEVVIYDKELSSSEVAERWNNGDGVEWVGDGEYMMSGTYLSNYYNGMYPNKEWEKIFFNTNIPTGTTVTFKARTSSNGIDWGTWSAALANGDDIIIDGRFIQWKADLTTTDDSITPKVYDTSITYLENRRTVLSP